jgi:hypothetical protein
MSLGPSYRIYAFLLTVSPFFALATARAAQPDPLD